MPAVLVAVISILLYVFWILFVSIADVYLIGLYYRDVDACLAEAAVNRENGNNSLFNSIMTLLELLLLLGFVVFVVAISSYTVVESFNSIKTIFNNYMNA